jgi:methyl-accepting chemotaxis protein
MSSRIPPVTIKPPEPADRFAPKEEHSASSEDMFYDARSETGSHDAGRAISVNFVRLILGWALVMLGAGLVLGGGIFIVLSERSLAGKLEANHSAITRQLAEATRARQDTEKGWRDALEKESIARRQPAVDALAKAIAPVVQKADVAAAEPIIRLFLLSPDIAGIRIDDAKGNFFIGGLRSGSTVQIVKAAPEFQSNGQSVKADIVGAEGRLGAVSLYAGGEMQSRLALGGQTDPAVSRAGDEALANSINDRFKMVLARHNTQMRLLRLVESLALIGVIALMIGFFIRYRLLKPLGAMLDSLADASDKIQTDSTHVTRDAEALATVTSRQAASIEEIAATVEELSSMTQRNADHARQTDGLMGETRTTVAEASTSMHSLFDAIQEIKRSSAETSKIIRTIDEISFQTNILALNAAIEAARAGVYGASFAVVADEVRTLARHAAEAAKSTAVLIETTNQKVTEAATLVEETRLRFDDVNGRVSQSSGFVSQIAEASAEQARGIDQLNTGIGEIDKVIQQTVANAEHSAAASKQMTEESADITAVLGDLRSFVGVQRNFAQKKGASSGRIHLKISVCSFVAESLAKWTVQTPVEDISRFDSPYANRGAVDVVLEIQILKAGGLDFDYEFVVLPNHGRALIEVAQGYVDLTAEAAWHSEIDSNTMLKTDSVMEAGEFEKGIYVLPTNQKILKVTSAEQLREFAGATVFNWWADLKLLQNMELKRVDRASCIEKVFQMIHEGRSDFTMLEFASTADISIESNGLKLIPIPNCKVALPDARSWVISKASPHAEAIEHAFRHGLKTLQDGGQIRLAYEQSGFYHPTASHWKRLV